jgi:hypothetical protein
MSDSFHNDFGEQFRKGIEGLSKNPGSHIWENITFELDKYDKAAARQNDFSFKKVSLSAILLLMTLSIADYYPERRHSQFNISRSSEVKQEITLKESGFHKYGLNSSESDISMVPTDSYINKEFKEAISKELSGSTLQQQITGMNIEDLHDQFSKLNNGLLEKQEAVIQNHLAPVYVPKINSPEYKFWITLFAAPEMAGYNLENDEIGHYINKTIIQNREKHEISPSIGLLFGMRLNKVWSLQSGITYSYSNISINPSKIYAERNNSGDIKYRYNTSSGFGYFLPSFNNTPAIGDSVLTSTSHHTLQYVSVPLMLKYHFRHGRFSFNPSVGINFGFLTKSQLEVEFEDAQHREIENVTNLEGLSRNSYSVMFNPELQYHLSDNWSLTAIPYVNYALAPINKGNVVKTYPYHIGLGLGATFNFKSR